VVNLCYQRIVSSALFNTLRSYELKKVQTPSEELRQRLGDILKSIGIKERYADSEDCINS